MKYINFASGFILVLLVMGAAADIVCMANERCAGDFVHKCQVPFKYAELTYATCPLLPPLLVPVVEPPPGAVWCPYEIFKNGTMVPNRWGLCQCQGTPGFVLLAVLATSSDLAQLLLL